MTASRSLLVDRPVSVAEAGVDPSVGAATVTASPRWVRRASDVVALCLVVSLGLILLRTARYYPEIGYDESAAILGVSLLHGHFGNHSDPYGASFYRYKVMDCYPPAYYAVSAVVFATAGFGIVQARAVSAFFVAGTALLAYVFGRRHAGPAAGFLSLAAYGYVPLRVYVLVARPDVAVPFFALGSVLVLLEGRRRGAPWLYGAAGMLYGLAVLSHFGGIMLAPLMGALLLWLAAGQGRLIGRVAAYAAAGGALLAAYVWLLHPHERETLAMLIRYADVGTANTAPGSMRSRWPVRSLVQHFHILRIRHAIVLFGMVPMTVAAAAGAILSSRFRRALGLAGMVAVLCFIGAFVFVGAYPNIAVFGYYGPFYLVFAGCALASVVDAVLPARMRASPISPLVAAILAAASVLLVGREGDRLVALMQKAPVSSVERFTRTFGRLLQGPTLASPHAVFSAAGDRVLARSVVKDYAGTLDLERSLALVGPEVPPLDSFRAMITDQYDEVSDVGVLLAYARQRASEEAASGTANGSDVSDSFRQGFMGSIVLRLRDFQLAGALRDDARTSGSISVWSRVADSFSRPGSWSRVARASPAVFEEHPVTDNCVVSLDEQSLPAPSRPRPWLWSWRVPLEAPPSLGDALVLARFGFRGGSPAGEPRSFLVYYPSAAEEHAGNARIREGLAPELSPAAAIGVAGMALADGHRGRDLLIHPAARGAGAALVLYSLEPLVLDEVSLAIALPPGRTCSPRLVRRMQRVVGEAASAASVISYADAVTSGEPVWIELNRAVPVELVVFRDGKEVQRRSFAETARPDISLPGPGHYGIEVWMTNPVTGRKAVVPVFTDVTHAP